MVPTAEPFAFHFSKLILLVGYSCFSVYCNLWLWPTWEWLTVFWDQKLQTKESWFVCIRSVGLSEEYNLFVVFIASMLLIMKCCPIFHHCTIVIFGHSGQINPVSPTIVQDVINNCIDLKVFSLCYAAFDLSSLNLAHNHNLQQLYIHESHIGVMVD